MSIGSITEKDVVALTDLNYQNLHVLHIRENVYGLLYTTYTLGGDTYFRTFEIDATGDIGEFLDTVRLNDTGFASDSSAISVSGSNGVIVFHLVGATSGSIQTRQVAANGTIGNVIDSFTYSDGDANITHTAVQQVTSSLFVGAYRSSGDQEGTAGTFTCDITGNLSNGFIDTYKYAFVQASWPHIIVHGRDNGKNVVLFVRVDGNWATVVTAIKISDAGTFDSVPTVVDRIDTGDGYYSSTTRVHLNDRIYLTAAQGVSSQDGWLYTWTLNTDGTVPFESNPINAYEYAPVKGIHNQVVHVGSGIVLVASADIDGNGWVRSWSIDTAGEITTTPLDTYEFADGQAIGEQAMLLTQHDNIVLLASRGGVGEVKLYTFEVETPVIIHDHITITTNAHIRAIDISSITSDALIRNIETATISSDSLIIPVYPPTDYAQIVSNAEIISKETVIITTDAYIVSGGSSKYEVQSYLRKVHPAPFLGDGGFQIF